MKSAAQTISGVRGEHQTPSSKKVMCTPAYASTNNVWLFYDAADM